MIVWLDAQLPFAFARWMTDVAGVTIHSVRTMRPRPVKDLEIFMAARTSDSVVSTKDRAFSTLVARHGPPPQIVQLSCGILTNRPLIACFEVHWSKAAQALASGNALVVM